MKYHLAIAGAGLSGAVLARKLAESGKFKITIFEEKNHVGGNCYTSRDEETGIMIHHHGAHVFHTNHEEIWNYINQWGKFEPYTQREKAQTSSGIYPFPINLLTINQFFSKKMSPREARDFIGSMSDSSIQILPNFESKAKQYIGTKLYEEFMQSWARKIYGTSLSDLSSEELISSLIKFSYEDNRYENKYQGIPVSGYTEIIKRIIDHHDIELRLGQKLDPERKRDFDHTFWSGPMDGFFKYKLGELPYRTLKFERVVEDGDYQGTPVMNYSHEEIPFARITEFKHLTPWEEHEKTICYKEYYRPAGTEDHPSFAVRLNSDRLFDDYVKLAKNEKSITFIGRLGTFRNINMDFAIQEALLLGETCLSHELKDWPLFSTSSPTKDKL